MVDLTSAPCAEASIALPNATERRCERRSPEEEEQCEGETVEEEVQEERLRLSTPLCLTISALTLDNDEHELSGLGSTPRLRRLFHFPVIDPPSTPAIDSLISQPPFHRPPPHILADPLLRATIDNHPDLFRVVSPINVERFSTLLTHHPNRPLVNSVIMGLTHGFWPMSDGLSQPPNYDFNQESLDDATLDEMGESAEKSTLLGHYSPPFKVLEYGMVVSPQLVVVVEGKPPRVVVDQTGSGLNAGISKDDAGTSYDTTKELVSLIRWMEKSNSLGYLFKADVKGAFKIISMCIEWQVRQVVRVRHRMPDDTREWWYHVDRTAVFRGRASPKIFCTVLNLVLWGARQYLRIPYPLAYVDDVFSLTTTKELLAFTFDDGSTRNLPAQLARLLGLWRHLGIPFTSEKTLFSDDVLPVLGFDISLSEMTISVPVEAIGRFRKGLRRFLQDRGNRPPLREWSSIIGWTIWACVVIPFARPAIQPLYDKVKGKSVKTANVSLNREVRACLQWFEN